MWGYATWVLVGVGGVALAGERTSARPAPLDLEAHRDDLRFAGDGKGHLLAFVLGHRELLFYGDGTTFHQMQVDTYFRHEAQGVDEYGFWDPRGDPEVRPLFAVRTLGLEVACTPSRRVAFEPVVGDRRAALLAGATFYGRLWNRTPFALARDAEGLYYYVDTDERPANSGVFRVYRGPRGNLAPLPMTNVVHDTEGSLFVTRKGHLRLALGRDRAWWRQGSRERPLVMVPVADNLAFIYRDLGVYFGARLGTPCDDL